MTRSRQLIAWLLPPALLLSGCGRAVDEPGPPPAADATPVVAAAEPPPATPPPAPDVAEADWEAPTDAPDETALDPLREAARAAAASGRWSADEPMGAIEAWSRVLLTRPDDAEALAGRAEALAALPEVFSRALAEGDEAAARRVDAVLRRLAANPETEAQRRARLADLRAALDRVEGARRLDDAEAGPVLQEVLRRFPALVAARDLQASRQRRLLVQAESAARNGRFDDAERRIAQAEGFGPDTPAVQDAEAAIAAIRMAQGEALLQQAGDAIDRLDLVAAARLLAAAEAAVPQAGALDGLRDRLQLARRYGHFRPGQVFTELLGDGGDGPAMVVVPHGDFRLGSPPDEPGHRRNEGPVTTVRFERGFAIAVHEVTVEAFGRFVKATGYRTLAERRGRSTVYDEAGGAMVEARGAHWRRDFSGRGGPAPTLPVVHIAHEDAVAYTEWLSLQTGQRYRLPSEAEFEYALRGGTRSAYPWGQGAPSGRPGNMTGARDRSPSGRRWGNGVPGYADGHWGPAPVASFAREAFGTHDLLGNVSEWVLDCWHDSYHRAPTDGRAWVNPGCRERVVRGASWASDLTQARSAFRLQVPAETTSARVGFRVARDL